MLLISEATAYSFSSAYLSTTLHSDVGAHGPRGLSNKCVQQYSTSQFTTSRQLSTARASFKMALSGDDDDSFYGDVMSNTFAGTNTHTHIHTGTRVFSLYLTLSRTHTRQIYRHYTPHFSFALSIFFSNTVFSILFAFDHTSSFIPIPRSKPPKQRYHDSMT